MISLRRRLTNELDEMVSFDRLVRHAPLAFIQSCIRVVADVRPQSPWIPFDATMKLRKFLRNRKDTHVLEYGSGMSTLWFARHACRVTSVESNPLWAEKVQKDLIAHGLHDKVRFIHASATQDYVNIAGVQSESIDLVVVDGDHRLESGLHALSICRPNGLVYVDDSDKRRQVAEMAELVDAVMSHASSVGGICELITDYSPAQAFPKQGLLAWLSAEEMRKC